MVQNSFIPLIGRNQRVAVRNTGFCWPAVDAEARQNVRMQPPLLRAVRITFSGTRIRQLLPGLAGSLTDGLLNGLRAGVSRNNRHVISAGAG